MKKIFFLLLSLPILLFASSDSVEKRIYKEIFKALFPEKQTIYLWVDANEKIPKLRFEKNPRVLFVVDPQKADLLVLYHRTDIQTDKPVLIGRYSLLKVYGDRVVAGFYWKKGRPHLIFFEKGLRRYGMTLPSHFREYLERNP